MADADRPPVEPGEDRVTTSYGRLVRAGARAAVRAPGIWTLKAVRALPLMRSRVIPWLLRQEIAELPTVRKAAAMRQALKLATKGTGPILIGPWLSEVGYEVLYWIPFLRWALGDSGIPPERCYVVSRGGAGVWYRDLARHGVDVFDLMTVEDFRRRNETRWSDGGNQKQMVPGQLDRDILRLAKERMGLGKVPVLHPSIMNQLFRYYWYDKGAYAVLAQHTSFARLPSPGVNDALGRLPRDYVAVRFYARSSFPDTAENRELARTIVRAVASEMPVVLLNTGLSLDDHADFDPGPGAAVHRIDDLMQPSRNLELQSQVIARARAFVGTYGGLAYLGPMYGVPTLALYSDEEGLLPPHVAVSHRLGNELDTPFVLLHSRDVDLVGLTLGVSGAGRRVARAPSPWPTGRPDESRPARPGGGDGPTTRGGG